ncbi:hypothetical protein PVT71_28805 (plasmid) [Salipiger sp. H15]|uniref:Uncharacterized protein n=1 Tax=Alloyangia sp. H15 TaxID=3029062 RepID=A0AAU8ASC3_9RHOB
MGELIRIVYTACAVAQPTLCEDHVLVPAVALNEMSCLTHAQGEIARALLPGWRVTRFGCTRA